MTQDIADQVSPATETARKHISLCKEKALAQVGGIDWGFLQDIGEDKSAQIGVVADEIWNTMLTDEGLHSFSMKGAEFYEKAQKDLSGHNDRAICWIVEHPKEAAALAVCVLAAPTIMAGTPSALGLAGFTTEGVALGISVIALACTPY